MAGSGWKDYLTFTRKERTGVIVILGLIAIIYMVPAFLPDDQAIEVYYNRDSLQQLSPAKTLSDDQLSNETENSVDGNRIAGITIARFPFDPNTLDAQGWQRLGVSSRTIRTIMNYRSKGGKFRQPADLRKIYGMRESDCEQLIPFVRIQSGKAVLPKQAVPHWDEPVKTKYPTRIDSNFPKHGYKLRKAFVRALDINLADSAAWEQLPAIGSRLAARIVLFRERLGGFYKVQQVGETYGISDSVFNVIITYLNYSETPLKKININELPASELAKHPYIRWTLANAIINYRNQHGSFKDLNDLNSIGAIPPAQIEKLIPYLIIK